MIRSIVRRRNAFITVFVVSWMLVFLYETFRASYLSPLLRRELPKVPLLFPPAGWIMFFNVDQSYGFAEIYGLRGTEAILLEPRAIFKTRNIGYDNIRRNVLIGVLDQRRRSAFCRYLRRRFPQYHSFAVVYAHYPDLIDTPSRVLRQVMYRCP